MRGHRAVAPLGLVLLICGTTVLFATLPIPEFRSAGSRQNTILSEPCPARDFLPIEIGFASVISVRQEGTTTGIRCISEVRRRGEPVRGVPITLGGDLIDGDGNTVAALPTRSGTTNRAGQKTFTFPYSVPPPGSQLGVIMEGMLDGDQQVDALDTTCTIIQREPCNNSSTQACLSGRRFKVEVEVMTGGGFPGELISASKTEARFTFGSGSTDLLVQLLQRCTNNSHYWVFADTLSSAPFELTVTDTFNGVSRAYDDAEFRFGGVTDTAAFATCP